MARPVKKGLDYFPMDVDFFTDDKIRFVAARFEEKGELIAAKLLCKIYKEGYCIKWDDDVALLFATSAGKNITYGLVNDVVNELLKRGFFSRTMHMRFSILTSKGIQERYERIKKDAGSKVGIEEKYRVNELTDEETGVNWEETIGFQSENATKESKVKESKVNQEANASPGAGAPLQQFGGEDNELRKEFKHLDIPAAAKDAWILVKHWITEKKPQFIEPYVIAWNIFASFYKLPAVQKITDSRRRKFSVRIKESGFDFFEVLAKVKDSEFLKTGSWFGFDWIFENDKNYLRVLEGQYR